MPRLRLLFLNLGHAYDHWFILILATAVIGMEPHFGLSYGELLALSTPGFVAFGLGAIPAGWLGDRWSREGMLAVFFLGLGGACLLTGLVRSPLELAAALTLLGAFASIYHPVGVALVAEAGPPERLGRRMGLNGVWGNMGVAGAALVTGILVDVTGWRTAFLLPGGLAVVTGLAYLALLRRIGPLPRPAPEPDEKPPGMRSGWQRVLGVVAVATLMVALQFNATTVALPKVLEERLAGVVGTAAGVGGIAAGIYALAAFVQILAGMALDRFSVRPLLLAVASGQVVAMLVATATHGWAMVAAGAVVMILVFAQVPVGATLVARYTPERLRARVYGIQFLAVFGVGGLAVPLVAVLHGLGGFAAMFVTLAAFGAVTWVAALWLPRETRRAVERV